MKIKNVVLAGLFALAVVSCKNEHDHEGKTRTTICIRSCTMTTMRAQPKFQWLNRSKNLRKGGYEIFDYVDEDSGDTIIMQQYFMAFLKTTVPIVIGPRKNRIAYRPFIWHI